MPRHADSKVKQLSPRAGDPAGRRVWWCAALIVAAGAGAWCNSFRGPFLFDDELAIAENPTIRRLWPPGAMLNPPAQGQAVQRRPVANVSLAINYAISKLDVGSYHATNLLLHVLAGLTLLGVVRRTLESPRLRGRFGPHTLALAATIAVLWLVHPLQTEAVTYVIQRTEVLAGLFYLLTLYAVIRGAHSPTPRRWYAGAVGACLLAMGSKESAVSAPLIVLLYDRLFLGPTWADVWRKRWGLYAGLAATWIVVAVLIPHGQEGSQIFGDPQVRTQYALAQGEAIVRYLALCFWPAWLVLDYGRCPPQQLSGALPYLAVVGALLGATVWALWRRPGLAFLGVCFFAILAPSSSIVPLPQQVAAEKRMYLPLAAVVTLTVLGAWSLWRALAGRFDIARPRRWPNAAPAILGALVALALGGRTLARNADYRTAETIWQKTVDRRPDNSRAHNNLANALLRSGRFDEAIEHYRRAVQLTPDFAAPQNNWGAALAEHGLFSEAIGHYERAAAINPGDPEIQHNWGAALAGVNQYEKAIIHYRLSLAANPNQARAHCNLGTALLATRRFEEAASQFQQAVAITPNYPQAHANWGVALARMGRLGDAAAHLRLALSLDPDQPGLRENLRNVEAALRKNPSAPASAPAGATGRGLD